MVHVHNVGPCGAMTLEEPLDYYLRNNICFSCVALVVATNRRTDSVSCGVPVSPSASLCVPLSLPFRHFSFLLPIPHPVAHSATYNWVRY